MHYSLSYSFNGLCKLSYLCRLMIKNRHFFTSRTVFVEPDVLIFVVCTIYHLLVWQSAVRCRAKTAFKQKGVGDISSIQIYLCPTTHMIISFCRDAIKNVPNCGKSLQPFWVSPSPLIDVEYFWFGKYLKLYDPRWHILTLSLADLWADDSN